MGMYEHQRNNFLQPYKENSFVDYEEVTYTDAAGIVTGVCKMYPKNPPKGTPWKEMPLVETIQHLESGGSRNVPRKKEKV